MVARSAILVPGSLELSRLAKHEKETIVVFNEADNAAVVFTYNRDWQRNLEEGLGVKPLRKNRGGGREYRIPKELVMLQRSPRAASIQKRSRPSDRRGSVHKRAVSDKISKATTRVSRGARRKQPSTAQLRFSL
jgi:hypothetical protein